METNADRLRDSAADHVNHAAKDLAEILIEKCSGHDDFSEEYQVALRAALNKLMEVDHLIQHGK